MVSGIYLSESTQKVYLNRTKLNGFDAVIVIGFFVVVFCCVFFLGGAVQD